MSLLINSLTWAGSRMVRQERTHSRECRPGSPSKSKAKPNLDPVSHVVPIVSNHVVVGSAGAISAGQNRVEKAGSDNEGLVRALCKVQKESLTIWKKVVRTHRGD